MLLRTLCSMAAAVVVLPSARVPPVVWSAGGDTWKDRLPHPVHLGG